MERLEWMEKILATNMTEPLTSSSEEEGVSSSNEGEDGSYVSTSSFVEEEEEQNTFYIFRDENPYKIVEKDEENGVYQVIGNEIILLAKAEGVCCLCSEVKNILFVDNSYGGNIATQVCFSCIKKILKEE